MFLAVGRSGSQLQNKGGSNSFLHPAALCEGPDGTHLFSWPRSDVGMKHQPLQLLPPIPPTSLPIPQSQGCGTGLRQLAEVAMIHFSLRTCATLPSPLPLTFSCAAGMGCSFASPAHFLPGNGAMGILWERVTFSSLSVRE